MKYTLDCDILDGLVFIDQSYLSELHDDDLLYAMDILLDTSGTSELIFDFPNEDWDTVRQRETEQIREFCGQGKMIVWLLDRVVRECEFTKSNEITAPCKWLHLPTGKLLAVTASELIQCLPYPDSEMEIVFELSLEAGWYAIQNEGIDHIMYCKKQQPASILSNIQEISYDMAMKKGNEELIEAFVKAAGAAFSSLKETTKEHFYFYTFVFDEGLHPYISAWSYEALEKSILEQQIPDDEKSWWKWNSADSPYAVYGYDEFFGEVSELLDKRASELTDDELYESEWVARINFMEEAMKRLDASGLFGTGKERECVVINVEQAPPDDDGAEYNRALRLNPSSVLLSEYLETCESPEDSQALL